MAECWNAAENALLSRLINKQEKMIVNKKYPEYYLRKRAEANS